MADQAPPGTKVSGNLLLRFDNPNAMPACLLVDGFRMGTMGLFFGRLFSRLGNVGGALGQILSLFLLFVNDFLIVSYVSWIGHHST